MGYPIKTCVICGEEFELKPNKPGYANRCPECSEPDETDQKNQPANTFERQSEADAERRKVIRDMLYRKDS